MLMRMNRTLIIFSVFLFFTSCYFTSVNPLSAPAESVIDEELLGSWTLIPEKKDEKDKAQILFLKQKGKYLRIIIIINDKELDGEYVGFCSTIGDRRFLNVQATGFNETSWKMEKDDAYSLAYYTIEKNELVTRLLNDVLIKKLIKEKKLRGTIEKSKYGDSVQVTDTTENLKKFVMKETLENLTDKEILFKGVRAK